jgi:peptide/nickel transport system substrate-binding protein
VQSSNSDGGQSTYADPKLDDIIVRAGQATGDERKKLFQEAFRYIAEDLIGDVPMFHMVGYTRVSPRLNFKPDISTNSEMQISKITFK